MDPSVISLKMYVICRTGKRGTLYQSTSSTYEMLRNGILIFLRVSVICELVMNYCI